MIHSKNSTKLKEKVDPINNLDNEINELEKIFMEI